jgi:hypothetical protein
MAEREGRRACCLVSEVLEEAGLDRKKARLLRRQLLEGLILMARWQLERMDTAEAGRERRPRSRAAAARKVPVE